MKNMVISDAAKTFLQNAIESVAARQPFELVAGDHEAGRQGASRAHLTKRQIEVLGLLCEGMTNKDISRTLRIGNATVKIHVSSILRALNVTSRLQATIAARRCGLVDDGEAGVGDSSVQHGMRQPVVLRVVWDGRSAQIIGVDQETVI